MVPNPALNDILDLTDPGAAGRLVVTGSIISRATGRPRSRLIRNNNGNCALRLCRPTAGNGFEDIDLSTATVRTAIGIPDAIPVSGFYNLAPNPDDLDDLTSDLDVSATALEVETALNATDLITAAGGVGVTSPRAGTYRVTWNETGERPAISGPDVENISPASVVSVSRIVPGSSTKREVQIIRLLALPYCSAVLATPFPSAASTIVTIRDASQSLPAIVRLTLDPIPCGGMVRLTLDNRPDFDISYNASASEVLAMAGSAYRVCKQAENVWDIIGTQPAQDITLTANLDALIVPRGVTGNMPLNTEGIFQLFANSADKIKTLYREITVEFPGDEPLKVLLETVEFHRDLLNTTELTPTVLNNLQFVFSVIGQQFAYDPTITALRSGAYSLESVNVAARNYSLGQLLIILENGHPSTWRLKTGAANSGDPNGEVGVLSDGSKHWERAPL